MDLTQTGPLVFASHVNGYPTRHRWVPSATSRMKRMSRELTRAARQSDEQPGRQRRRQIPLR
jgi:hypothetical protein